MIYRFADNLSYCGLPKEEHDKFGLWAFGDNYKKLEFKEMYIEWNKLHGNELKLDKHDLIRESTKKMIEIYKKELTKE